ncbi:TIR domain-containing protein [Carnobacterium maltaromaticum]|uniref:TIR domain-containing protein n=1 Tax=Carnobacterium maltaromaticum TaxID=2751 RepID=UPI00295EEEF9|nr:TIR domain-containing protein [Carnobacterium maltaromaticum]
MVKAFLSHNYVDKEFVLNVARELGYSESIVDSFNFTEGEDFRTQIKDHLKKSELFVLFASEKSLAAPWVNYEINLAELFILSGEVSNILVFLIGDVTHNDLPSWLTSSLVKHIDSHKIAASIIKSILQSRNKDPLYIGRGETQNKFDTDYFKSNKDVRNIVFHGLPGIGRKTFAKNAIKNTFSFNLSTEYKIEETEPLISLYRQLLIDFYEIKNAKEFSQYRNVFQKLSTVEKIEEIMKYLNRYSNHRQVPVLVDNGGMLDSKGQFNEEITEMLKQINNTDNLFVAYILLRNPKDYKNGSLFFSIYIPELNKGFTEHLLRQYCNHYYDVKITKEDAEEIGNYLSGYPPTIEIASSEINNMGVEIVKNRPHTLISYTKKTFDEYFDKYIQEEKAITLLKILSNFNNELTHSVIDVLIPNSINELSELIDLNVVKINHDSRTYSISLPLLNFIGERFGILTKKEYTSITLKLKKRFWTDENEDVVNSATLNTIIYSLLRSNTSSELSEFKNWIVPSDILNSAKKAYQNSEWKVAMDLFEQLLKVDEENIVALEYLIRSKIRLGEKSKDELNRLGKVDKDRYDLVLAFKLIKNDDFERAIELLEEITKKPYFPPHVYRELGECYFQIGDYENVQKNINKSLSDNRSKKNPYILDLAAKNAIKIGDYKLAEEYIELLDAVDDLGSVSHRRATLFFKQGMLNEALDHSNKAVKSRKIRLEFYLLLANILLDLDKLADAKKVLNEVEIKYSNANIKNNTGFNRLQCVYYIRVKHIPDAERYFKKISNNKSIYLEIELLKLKISDPKTNLILKEQLKEKIKKLENTEHEYDLIGL